MRRVLYGCILSLVAGAAGSQTPSAAIPRFECDRSPLLIRRIDVWTPRGVDRHDVLVVDGRIQRIAPPGKIPKPREARLINGAGKVLFAGLIDAHAHFV